MIDVEGLSMIPPWEWGPEAGRVLREALADTAADPSERLLAAEMAGSLVVMDDAMAGALLHLLRSPDEPEDLRGAAAISLGPVLQDLDSGFYDDEFDEAPISEETEAEVRRALREVYQQGDAPMNVRRRALEASVRVSEGWHAGAVRAAYHSGHDEWRRTAVFCMGWGPGFEDEIMEALESGDPALRFEGVRAAGHRGLESAWPHLREILRRPGSVDRPLLLAAIDAAAEVSPRAAGEVLQSLVDTEDEEVADAAWDAMAMCDALTDPDLFDEDDDWPDDDPPPPARHGNGSGGGGPA